MENYIYYLYDNTDVVRYVGRGKGKRANTITGRSKEFLSILNDSGYTKIIQYCKSTKEAIDLELLHIKLHENTIINKHKNYKHNALTYSELNELFEIDSSSPSGIVWKQDRYNASNTKKATKGEPAGNINSPGYWVVPFKGRYIKVHRVIFVLYNKINLDDPDLVINHIDGNGLNNKIDNLEICSFRDNAIRTTKRTRNTSGVVGVCLYHKHGKLVAWKARINVKNGKRISKDFNIEKYGYDEAFRLACEWRKQMEELYYNKPEQ